MEIIINPVVKLVIVNKKLANSFFFINNIELLVSLCFLSFSICKNAKSLFQKVGGRLDEVIFILILTCKFKSIHIFISYYLNGIK